MPLNKDLRQHLATEYRFAAEQIKEGQTLSEKLFFFSALFGEAQRILNREWDNDLALVFSVTQKSHQEILGRLNALRSDADPVIQISQGVLTGIAVAADSLAKHYDQERPSRAQLMDTLGKLAAVAYATTGNGYYRALKGLLKV